MKKEGTRKAQNNEKNGLIKKNYIGYGLGELGEVLTFSIMSSFLTPYYLEVAKISPATLSLMYLILKTIDAISNPLMGIILDKFHVKWPNKKGKYRPWMLRAAPLIFITAILMYTAPTYVEGVAKVIVAYLTYFLYQISYTVYNISFGTLLSAMAKTDIERTKLSSARGLGTLIGLMFTAVLMPLVLDYFSERQQTGYTIGVTIIAAIGLVACLLGVFWTEERNISSTEEKDPQKNDFNFKDITSLFTNNRSFVAMCVVGVVFNIQQFIYNALQIYVFRDVYGALTLMSITSVIGTAFSIFALSIIPSISKKIGLLNMVKASQLISVTAFVITYFLSSDVISFMIGSSIANGFAMITVQMQWGMVGQVMSDNEYRTGKNIDGTIYGTFNLSRRIGQAIGSAAAIWILTAIGFVPGSTSQTIAALSGLKASVLIIPAVGVSVCFLAYQFLWNITDEDRKKMA